MQQGGVVGLLLVFLYLVGSAFAFGMPVVSFVVFILAALYCCNDAITVHIHGLYFFDSRKLFRLEYPKRSK